jgi:hypothetical protein
MITKAKTFIEIEEVLKGLLGEFVAGYTWDKPALLLGYEANIYVPYRYTVRVVCHEEIGAPKMEVRSIDTRTFGPLVNEMVMAIADIDWMPTEEEKMAELHRRNPDLVESVVEARLAAFNSDQISLQELPARSKT